MDITNTKDEISRRGFTVINNIYTDIEISDLQSLILEVDTAKSTFRKTDDLFAIRQFLKEVPEAFDQIFNSNLKKIISDLFGNDFFVVKSIYFDKPENSNWFVAYHQDLTIAVHNKMDLDGFTNWTNKQGQFAVQPPLHILQDNFTIRIHLDEANEGNGALKVISTSHLRGIYRPEHIDWNVETETICEVEKGGIMLMKPLLLHASSRTTNKQKRRVLHIEFSRSVLPIGLNWAEKNDRAEHANRFT